MRASVDIPQEVITRAYHEISKKVGICEILPMARVVLRKGTWCYAGLVCDDRMEGQQTGVGAECCKQCCEKDRRDVQ